MIQEALTFDDVLLVPKYSEIESRKQIDLKSKLGLLTFGLPIISSPMDTITEDEMAVAMYKSRGLGIIHRYCTIDRQVEMFKKTDLHSIAGAAIGVTSDFLERAQALFKAGCTIICIDVAHGDHILVKKAIEEIKKINPFCHIMAGNVASGEGFIRLAQWGADSIRVGIGGGSICSTRINTGFGVPNLSAIFDCVDKWKNWNSFCTEENGHVRKNLKKPALIIDGGIRTAGDIVKALAAGADFVMCGSLLAGTDETPGKVMRDNRELSSTFGQSFKVYRGMASKEAQTDFKGSWSSNEGISSTVPYKGSVVDILEDLAGNIRSGFSYAGARNLAELQANAQFIKQTHAGQKESFTHILVR